MSRRGRQGPVAVLVGETWSGHAVDWAAAEAAARQSDLCVVHGARLQWRVDPYAYVPIADFVAAAAATEEVLQAAVARARSVAPDVDVSAEALPDRSVRSLVSLSRRAQLLVLGGPPAPGAAGRRGSRAWSTRRVTARAWCPVALIRPPRSPYDGTPPRVVVGVDGSAASGAALAFALRAAAQRGLPLTVVHAWTPSAAAQGSAAQPSTGSEARARMVLDQVLAYWQNQFLDVAVEDRLTCGDPAVVLTRESAGAAMLVVGSRGRGIAQAGLFGSVSQAVTQQARCAVVVVRPDDPGNDEQVRGGGRGVVFQANRSGTGSPLRWREPRV